MLQQTSAPRVTMQAGQRSVVLIAHENDQVAADWRAHLERYGCDVLVASSGVECLWQIHRQQPDVLLLSHGLLWGGADGVLAYLREAGLSPPVVLITDAPGAAPAEPDLPPVVRRVRAPVPLATLLGSVLSAVDENPPRLPPAPNAAPPSATLLAAQDLDLQQRVERALGGTGYPILRNVAVAVRAGAITLRGRVPTYHLKQLAQAAALKVADAVAVHNDIQVADRPEAPAGDWARPPRLLRC